jgi:signal transduction histidine kinase
VLVRVSDTGIGMSAAQLRQLFTPFFRAETPLHTASNGTGLGLLIARTLIELHHGTLGVESQPDVGSCFTVRLPIVQPVSDAA